jgi:Ca2+-binding RTX toxin-like protein
VTGTSGVNLNLSLSTPQASGGSGTDTLLGIENLVGSANNDVFIGTSGNNKLEGGVGNDILNGNTGADTMIGGDGSDIYYVDNIGDVVTETNATASTGGTDFVHSSLAAYTLGAYVENARILLSTAADLTGNSLDNVLYAGSGNNILNGAAGADTVSYLVGVTGTSGVNLNLSLSTPQASGGSGTDTLLGIENLTGSNFHDTLMGDNFANTLNGLDLNDYLSGGGGNDVLLGGNGTDLLMGGLNKDTLTGGAGNDTFAFGAVTDTGISSTTWDTITDFSSLQLDKIDLSGIDADTATVPNDAFSAVVVGGVFSGAFASPGDLYFDSVNRVLYGNTDGDATAEFAIALTGVTSLVAADFIL